MGLWAALWRGVGGPCANATYEHRIDDPETYNWYTAAALMSPCTRPMLVPTRLVSPPCVWPASNAAPMDYACPWGSCRCIVQGSGPDAFLFAGLSIMTACLLPSSPLASVLVLLAGAACEAAVFVTNLGRSVPSFLAATRQQAACSSMAAATLMSPEPALR